MTKDLQELYESNPEVWVERIFDLFEITDFIEEEMMNNKSIKPDLKWQTSEYMINYLQNCPVFRELLHSKESKAIAYLWRIKDFKIRLNRKSMENAPTYKKCLSCLRTNKTPACKMRCYNGKIYY